MVGKKERKHQRKQSVRQIPPTNAQKVRHSHAPLITIIWSCSPHVHPVQRGGREVFSRLLMNNNQASLFWTRSRSPDFILQRPVRYLHALTYLSMLSPLPASPLVVSGYMAIAPLYWRGKNRTGNKSHLPPPPHKPHAKLHPTAITPLNGDSAPPHLPITTITARYMIL